MIYRLLDEIVKQKLDGFPAIIVGLPATDTKPCVAVVPGQFQPSRTVRNASSQPAPLGYVQEVAVVQGQSTYKLDKNPLPGSMQCKGLNDADDFTVDLQGPALVLTATGLSKAASILVCTYSFAGIRAVQEFKQRFTASILAATLGEAEQWASLLVGQLLTGHDELIERTNSASVPYNTAGIVTRHFLAGFTLIDGSTEFASATATIHLTFEAAGQLELDREKADFGLIERVVSPGRTSSQRPIDVQIELA